MWPFGDVSLLNQIVFRSHQKGLPAPQRSVLDLGVTEEENRSFLISARFREHLLHILPWSSCCSFWSYMDFVWGCLGLHTSTCGWRWVRQLIISPKQLELKPSLPLGKRTCHSPWQSLSGRLWSRPCSKPNCNRTIHHSQSYRHHCSCGFIAVVASSGQNCRLGVWDPPFLAKPTYREPRLFFQFVCSTT